MAISAHNNLIFNSDFDSSSDDEIILIQRKKREYKERIDFFTILSDVDFVQRFRLSKSSFTNVLDLVSSQIERKTNR